MTDERNEGGRDREACMTNLEALAAKVEGLEAEDADLFTDAFFAAFPPPSRIWEDEDREEWTAEYRQWIDRQHRFMGFLDVGAWIDAAMQLAHEGWRLSYLHELDGGSWTVLLWRGSASRVNDNPPTAHAATAALALLAACLRARAVMEVNNG